MDINYAWGKTSPIGGGFGFPNMSRSEENMEVDDDRKNDMMKTTDGRTIDVPEASRSEERMEVNVCLRKSEFNISILKKARETSAERTRRNERGRRVVPDLDDHDMVVDIRKKKQGISKKVIEASEFDPSQSEVVKLTIKGKFHEMEPTEQKWSGAHSTCTVLRDIDDKDFKIAHKFATANDVGACRFLENTKIPPEVYYSIERKDNKIQMFMELIFPSATIHDVITKHMPLLSKKGLAKRFFDDIKNNLLCAVIKMHSNGATHGDLHAGNILLQIVNQSLNIRIIDFEKASQVNGNIDASWNMEYDFRMISIVISNLHRASRDIGDSFNQDEMNIRTTDDAKRLIYETNRNVDINGRDQAAIVQVLMDSILVREQQFPGTSKGNGTSMI